VRDWRPEASNQFSREMSNGTSPMAAYVTLPDGSSQAWRCETGDNSPIAVRELPLINGPRTEFQLWPGEQFEVCEEQVGIDGVLYLKLRDGRGWVFDKKPGVGTMCVPIDAAVQHAGPSTSSMSNAQVLGTQPLSSGSASDAPLTEGQFSISYRYRSPRLLLIGGISAFTSFFLTFVITWMCFFLHNHNKLGIPFKSGNGHFPATVSEGVSDAMSPAGKIFFAFGLVAGFCIFLSWYPYMLRNVYTGNEEVYGTSVYWISVRQFVPPVGLLVLICVQTVPASRLVDVEAFSVIIHLVGAGMMFVGYLACEIKCLHLFGVTSVSQERFLDIEGRERLYREICSIIIFFGFTFFCICQGILLVASSDHIMCCHDHYLKYMWEVTASDAAPGYNISKGHRFVVHNVEVMDTANGWVLLWKVASFMSECIAGVAMVISHLIIWYYCEERHVDYAPVPLQEVWDEDSGVMTEEAKRQLHLLKGGLLAP